MRQTLLIALFGMLWGCDVTKKPPQTMPTELMPSATVVPPRADPNAVFRPMVHLSIYQIGVPAGSVSRSDEFWKRVDERALDVATYDVLYKNGVRIGVAPLSEIDHFLEILDRNPVRARPTMFATAGVKVVELPMKRGVPSQTIYDFNSRNEMTIRTYDDCDNVLLVEFQAAPRKSGDVRIALCPMVRSQRKRLVAVGDDSVKEIQWRADERLYELNLKADAPLDSFLIIAPSPEAQNKMSLGQAFLVRNAETEQYEDVVIIVPQAVMPKRPKAAEAGAGDPAAK